MSSYTSQDITVLKGLEAVRKRPGMYIGSVDRAGVEHLFHEIIDNAIDEHIAGHCKNIVIKFNEDNSIEVTDDGRGIPVDTKEYGTSVLEIIMTTLHSGGKFNKGGAYSISGGLHGVGLSVVNALSEYLDITVYKDGKIWKQSYSRGKANSKLISTGTTDKCGTTIKYMPDTQIFKEIDVDIQKLIKKLHELCYLNDGLNISIEYLEKEKNEVVKEHISHEDGIAGYIKELSGKSRKPLIEIVKCYGDIPYKHNDENRIASYSLAFQWFEDYGNYSFHSFVNNIKTREGGTHEEAFKTALNNSFISYAKDHNLLRNNDTLPNWDDIKEGLLGIITLYIQDPLFEGQTKNKLRDNNLRFYLYKEIKEKISLYFEKNHKIAKAITEKIVKAANTREALYRTRDLLRKKNLSTSAQLPGKLAECNSNNLELRELFIVEGNSAGGSAKNGRDPEVQAILPIRGKILNIEKKSTHSILKNSEIQSLILAIGTGITNNFDYSKLRYNKIILMADADVDGQHIQLLLLTLIFRLMPELILKGHIYLANPPLYKATYKNYTRYCISFEELKQAQERIKEKYKVATNENILVQRFKGLGEMDAIELFETCMNLDNRVLTLCTIEDIEQISLLIDSLMGNDSDKRREFIKNNSELANQLDI